MQYLYTYGVILFPVVSRQGIRFKCAIYKLNECIVDIAYDTARLQILYIKSQEYL